MRVLAAARARGLAAVERALLLRGVRARAAMVEADERGDGRGRGGSAALDGLRARESFVVGAAGGGGDEARGDLFAVDEQRPEEQRLQPEGEQEPKRAGGGAQRRRDGDDERDDQRV